MSAYTRVLKSGGEIFLSGFYEDDLEDIRYAAKQNGMNFVLNKNCNKWVAAKFVRQ
jgi:ribosomal protein L11 methyltransferase